EGEHWSPPADVTGRIAGKEPRQTWFSTGPGNGIQLRDGRLVAPFYYRWQGSNTSYATVVYSDDHGKSWILAKPTGELTNEGQVVELADGSLVYNMRSSRGQNRRAISRSSDRGQTWTPPAIHPDLIEPVCQASFVRLNPAGKRRKNAVLFA